MRAAISRLDVLIVQLPLCAVVKFRVCDGICSPDLRRSKRQVDCQYVGKHRLVLRQLVMKARKIACVQTSRTADASAATDIAKLEERRQKIHNLIIQEKQSHDQKLAGLNAKLSDINARLTEYRQMSGQQVFWNQFGSTIALFCSWSEIHSTRLLPRSHVIMAHSNMISSDLQPPMAMLATMVAPTVMKPTLQHLRVRQDFLVVHVYR